MIDFFRRESAARERFPGSDDGQVDGARFGEVAVVLGHGRAGAVDDDDVFHALDLNSKTIATTSTPVITRLPSIPNPPPVTSGGPVTTVISNDCRGGNPLTSYPRIGP